MIQNYNYLPHMLEDIRNVPRIDRIEILRGYWRKTGSHLENSRKAEVYSYINKNKTYYTMQTRFSY